MAAKHFASHYPTNGDAAVKAYFATKYEETPSCMGAPSFKEMDERVNLWLGTAIVMHLEERITAFKEKAAGNKRSVNRTPYSDPDDRYESMGNDYGEDLYMYWEKGIRQCGKAMEVIEERKRGGVGADFTVADLERVKAEAEAAAAEKAAKRQEDMAKQQAAREQLAKKRTDLVDQIVSKVNEMHRDMVLRGEEQGEADFAQTASWDTLKDFLDSKEIAGQIVGESLGIDERWAMADVGAMVFDQLLNQFQMSEKGNQECSAEVVVPFSCDGALLVALVKHPVVIPGHKLAKTFWTLCDRRDTSVMGGQTWSNFALGGGTRNEDGTPDYKGFYAEKPMLAYENLLIHEMAMRFTEKCKLWGADGAPLLLERAIFSPGDSDLKKAGIVPCGELAQPPDATPKNRLIHWAAYKGKYGVLSALMSAYQVKVRGEESRKEILCGLKNGDGLNVFHMIARCPGADGKAVIPKMVRLVAKLVDPEIKSDGEKTNVYEYLERAHNAKFRDEIRAVILAERQEPGEEM